MRLMGLDFGSKTVGVAVSDELKMTATGVEIVRRESPNKLRRTLLKEYDVNTVILGYPVMLDGSEGERVEKTKEFAQMLERRTGVQIIFQDERLTTVEAYEIMDQMGIKKDDRYKYVDMLAAKFILEDYLNNRQ